MTEDSYVATRVREFAHHIQCDPELAQQLYFEYDVDLTFDGADKMSLGAEIKALVSLKRKLVTERDKLNTGDLLQITYKLSGHDLKSAFEPLISQIEEMLAFGKQKFNEETSGSRANMKAHAIAHYVAAMFVAHDRNVGFGVQPLDSSEPSTPFGRAVRDALEVFKVYKLPQGQHGALEIAHWKKPAEHAAKALKKSQ